MSIYEDIVVLREVPPFADLDENRLKLLAFVSTVAKFAAGEVVLKQGDKGDVAFVVVEGLVDVHIAKDGETTHVGEMGRHGFFGEIAVMRDTVRAATVTAKTDIVVLKITKNVLHEMIVDEPELGERIAEHIEKAGYTFS